MATLGGIFLNVVYDDTPQYSVKASEHPIEDSENIVDHVNRNAVKMSISGVVTGDDAAQKETALIEHMEKGSLLKYVHRTTLANVIITDFQPKYDKEITNGFKFSMSLLQIRLSKAMIIKPMSIPVKKQTKAVTKKGRQQKKKKQDSSQVKKKGAKAKAKDAPVSNKPILLEKLRG